MKLELRGHQERYAVEQSLLNLFPGESPVYGDVSREESSWAILELSETGDALRVTAELSRDGKTSKRELTERLTVTEGGGAERSTVKRGGAERPNVTEYEREGARRRLIARAFYLAAVDVTGVTPPWGMLSGVRPDKLVTAALASGRSEAQAQRMLQENYGVSAARASLAVETGRVAHRIAQTLKKQDVAVYVGIPFCPTRCAYCSFVSQSVEKSFPLMEPYVGALEEEIRLGGALAKRLGLRVRAFYMGGGTPTTLNPEQLFRVLTAFETSFDASDCTERTVEAGRPDTITAEKMEVLRECGVDRVSVNPQSMDDNVLKAIGRRHTADDVERAMKLASGFPHVNMDVIAGLPEDTPAGFAETLRRCIAFGPDNLTVHTLALKKGSRVMTQNLSIPDAESVGEMLEDAATALRGAGYAPYYLYRQKYMSGRFENIGWSKPDAICLYNILMMSELCGILSFGAGGAVKLVDREKNQIKRLFHAKYPEEYVSRPEKGAEIREAIAEFYGGASA